VSLQASAEHQLPLALLLRRFLMAFRFNFGPAPESNTGGECASGEDGREGLTATGSSGASADEALKPFVELFPISDGSASTAARVEEHIVSDVIRMSKGRLESGDVSRLLGLEAVTVADLIPGEYEGGFKLWEGSDDLVKCLCEEWRLQVSPWEAEFAPPPEVSGKRVLELGCGHGLPGVFAALAGASEVGFADFNAEVLTHLTAPNLLANLARLPPGRDAPSARYFAGDWLRTAEALHAEDSPPYDIILTSETVYSHDSTRRLLQALELLLPEGATSVKVYIAAKSYYFGVGGGAQQFQKLALQSGKFTCESVYAVEDGASNKREVMLLQRQPQS